MRFEIFNKITTVLRTYTKLQFTWHDWWYFSTCISERNQSQISYTVYLTSPWKTSGWDFGTREKTTLQYSLHRQMCTKIVYFWPHHIATTRCLKNADAYQHLCNKYRNLSVAFRREQKYFAKAKLRVNVKLRVNGWVISVGARRCTFTSKMLLRKLGRRDKKTIILVGIPLNDIEPSRELQWCLTIFSTMDVTVCCVFALLLYFLIQ